MGLKSFLRLRIPRSQLISNLKYNKVEYPEVIQFTFNLNRGRGSAHGGLRVFNRDLSPSIRYFNPEIDYVISNPNAKENKNKSTIDIVFKNGQSVTYDAAGKDSVAIFNELISVAKGVSAIPERDLPPFQIDATKVDLAKAITL